MLVVLSHYGTMPMPIQLIFHALLARMHKEWKVSCKVSGGLSVLDRGARLSNLSIRDLGRVMLLLTSVLWPLVRNLGDFVALYSTHSRKGSAQWYYCSNDLRTTSSVAVYLLPKQKNVRNRNFDTEYIGKIKYYGESLVLHFVLGCLHQRHLREI